MAARKLRFGPSGPLDGESIPPGNINGQVPIWDVGTDGYIPGIPSSGGGASWVTSMFVAGDANPAGADGTPGHPFTTIQEAHDALPLGGGTIVVGQSSIGYPPALVFDRPIHMVAISIGDLKSALDGIGINNVTTTAFLTASGFDGGNWNSNTSMVCKGCSGIWTVSGALNLQDCNTNGDTIASVVVAVNTNFASNISVTLDDIQLTDCDFIGTATFGAPGQLILDYYTNSRFQGGGGNIVNGIKFVRGAPAQTSIVVATPALVAGVMGYVDVTLVGTTLEGTPANAPILMNPRVDLVPGGATQGYYIGARMSALNTARLTFVGTLPGGGITFDISKF